MFWTSQLERRDCNRCHIAHETGQTERCLNGAAATISCPNGHATVCLWTYMVSSENSVFAGASTHTTCNVSFFSACGCLPPSNQMFQQRRRGSHQSVHSKDPKQNYAFAPTMRSTIHTTYPAQLGRHQWLYGLKLLDAEKILPNE
jgi:hypothetical protein